MAFQIDIGPDAQSDIATLQEYHRKRYGVDAARVVLDNIEEAVMSLIQHPQRGHRPHELYATDEEQVLEVIVGRYRILYLIEEDIVLLLAIFDGRQDIRSYLLKRKLLR